MLKTLYRKMDSILTIFWLVKLTIGERESVCVSVMKCVYPYVFVSTLAGLYEMGRHKYCIIAVIIIIIIVWLLSLW